MRKSGRGRLAALLALGTLTGLLATLAIAPSPAFASCGDPMGRTFVASFDPATFEYNEYWTGKNRPHPPGNGFVPRTDGEWARNPNFVETIDVAPGDVLEIGGEGISNTVRNSRGGWLLKPAIYIDQAWFPNYYLPVPDSNCDVNSWDNLFFVNEDALSATYTLYMSHYCAAHTASASCGSIVYPVVRLRVTNPDPPDPIPAEPIPLLIQARPEPSPDACYPNCP